MISTSNSAPNTAAAAKPMNIHVDLASSKERMAGDRMRMARRDGDRFSGFTLGQLNFGSARNRLVKGSAQVCYWRAMQLGLLFLVGLAVWLSLDFEK